MNAPVNYVQARRLLAISTSLGEDVLLLERFEGREGISSLFHFQATVRSKRDIRPAEIIGSAVDVTLDLGIGKGLRTWNGLVTGLYEGPALTRGLRSYALTIQPRLWLATQRRDCRIWLNKTSLQVAEIILGEHGIPAPDTSGVTITPKPLAYSVQWNESDFAYLVRRFEHDGLFYWFAHQAGAHRLLVANHASGYRDGAEPRVRLAFGSSDVGHIHDWRRQFMFTPGRHAARDWNFETPLSPPHGVAPSLVSLPPPNSSYEVYEYPGVFLTPADGEAVTRLRIQAIEAEHDVTEAGSTARTLAPGQRFTPYEVARPEQVYEPHVVTRIAHEAEDTSYEAGGNPPRYSNWVVAIPARVPATPHRAAAGPRIDGVQIALVAGPPGEEIHTDQHGRVKLKFPWDRRAAGDGSDTCWVRVAQSWAGASWGTQLIPRVGMEVVVAFLEGDPDRPVIVGAVPNSVNRTPYRLPDNKTRMTIKSKTYKGAGFNELSFEDASGREEVYLHAQRDLTTNVLNDDAQDVRHDRKVEIGNNHSLNVKQDRQIQIGNNNTVKIGQSRSETVGREMLLNVGERLVITVGQSRLEMTSDGKVTLTGSEFDFSTSGHLGIHGNPLDTSG
jgi:type VI secretion system secreted protein VgrG